MKDVMIVTQVMTGNDAARTNVGLGDSEASGNGFEAALNEQMTPEEQQAGEQVEQGVRTPPSDGNNRPDTGNSNTNTDPDADTVTVSGDEPVVARSTETAEAAMAALLPVALEQAAPSTTLADIALDNGVVVGEEIAAQPLVAAEMMATTGNANPLVTNPAGDAAGVAAPVNPLPPTVAPPVNPVPPTVAPLTPTNLVPSDEPVALTSPALGLSLPEAETLARVRTAAAPLPAAPGNGLHASPANNVPVSERPIIDPIAGEAIRHALMPDVNDGAPRAGDAQAVTPNASFASALSGVAQARMESTTAAVETRALPPLDAGMESSEWGSGLGARIVWGLANGVRAATLAVNPRDLGPVNIQLTMGEDEASIQFNSQHVMVREAIEAALPRLREALASEGIRLGDVAIGSGGESAAGDADARAGGSSRDADTNAQGDEIDAPMAAASRVSVSNGLVDTFA